MMKSKLLTNIQLYNTQINKKGNLTIPLFD